MKFLVIVIAVLATEAAAEKPAECKDSNAEFAPKFCGAAKADGKCMDTDVKNACQLTCGVCTEQSAIDKLKALVDPTAAPVAATAAPVAPTAAPTKPQPKKYDDIRCWINKHPQQIKRLTNYQNEADAINKCFAEAAAAAAGYDFFAVGEGGRCWAGKKETYKAYGEATTCPTSGKGDLAIVNVYKIRVAYWKYCNAKKDTCAGDNTVCTTYRCKCDEKNGFFNVKGSKGECLPHSKLPLGNRCDYGKRNELHFQGTPCADKNSMCKGYGCNCKTGYNYKKTESGDQCVVSKYKYKQSE